MRRRTTTSPRGGGSLWTKVSTVLLPLFVMLLLLVHLAATYLASNTGLGVNALPPARNGAGSGGSSPVFRASGLFGNARATATTLKGGGSGGGSAASRKHQSPGRSAAASTSTSTATASATTGAAAASTGSPPASGKIPIRVAYQGEPGAYSEKATRELLGDNVLATGLPNFEACFRAVSDTECDYACLPVENSLGGSIHENFDLMLRYDLTIVAEHEFRVHHCLLAAPGVRKEDVRFAISHPQALAQCDNYLRGLGITPVPSYDTAGSAKMIADALKRRRSAGGKSKSTNGNNGTDDDEDGDGRKLPRQCTPENTAAIASDLAGKTYGLNCLEKGIEDDDTNFTRFLLLARKGVVEFLTKNIPAKTSVVFTLPDHSGVLYRALACFSLRDIDCSKIESRPTSASLLSFLKFRSQVNEASRRVGEKARTKAKMPRFRYCFYLDYLASELDEASQNALHHLREQADFCRVLGSYPQKSRLVGPVLAAVEDTKMLSPDELQQHQRPFSDGNDEEAKRLKIGLIGYGSFGRFLAEKFVKNGHIVSCIDPVDKSKEAAELGVEYFPMFALSSFLEGLDVVILSVPQIELEEVVKSLPVDRLSGKLVVEVCPLSLHPKSILLRHLPQDVDIICSNPMFGPSSCSSSSSSWDGLPMVYDKVRVSDPSRASAFLSVFERARCKMVEMTADQMDLCTADAAFVAHLTGRLLDRKVLPPTLVTSKEYAALLDVAEMTSTDTFDEFYGLFKFNENAKMLLGAMRENLAKVERQLAAKEAYLTAKAEMQNSDRQRLIAECKVLLQEVVKDSGSVNFLKGDAPARSSSNKASGSIEERRETQ